MRSRARLTCIGAALVVVVAQLAGCATSTTIEPVAPNLAARAGRCDQVRVDEFMESAAGEMTHVHVWATVFRHD